MAHVRRLATHSFAAIRPTYAPRLWYSQSPKLSLVEPKQVSIDTPQFAQADIKDSSHYIGVAQTESGKQEPWVITRTQLSTEYKGRIPGDASKGSDESLPALHLPIWDGTDLKAYETIHRKPSSVPLRWLRDHCPCDQCVHPVTRQRQLETFKMDRTLRISECDVQHAADPPVVNIKWQDGHESVYPLEFLLPSRRNPAKEAARRGLVRPLWFGSKISASPPKVAYKDVQESGVGELTRLIRVHGFCLIEGCPETPEATQKLLELIGPIRNTHYGGFYDFTSDMASKDTAYTDLALEAHTDTTYFSDPAGLQMFHMLSHTDGKGGESLLVDGLRAADQLLRQDPAAYQILSSVGVHSHASGNEDVSVQPYTSFPALVHDRNRGHLVQIRWNNSDRAGLDAKFQGIEKWYNAAA